MERSLKVIRVTNKPEGRLHYQSKFQQKEKIVSNSPTDGVVSYSIDRRFHFPCGSPLFADIRSFDSVSAIPVCP